MAFEKVVRALETREITNFNETPETCIEDIISNGKRVIALIGDRMEDLKKIKQKQIITLEK